MTRSISANTYNGDYYLVKSREEKEAGLYLAYAASALVMGALPYFSKPFVKQMKTEHSNNHLYKDAFFKSFEISGLADKGVQFVDVQSSQVHKDIAQGLNACYVPSKKQVLLNSDKATISGFHELGHAMNHLKSKIGKLLQKCRKPGYAIAGFMATVALTSRNKPKESKRSLWNIIQDNSGKIAFIAILPTIIEEAMASYKGVELARKSGLAEPLVNNLKKFYGKALLSYAGYGLLAGLSVYAASKIMEKSTRPKKLNLYEL